MPLVVFKKLILEAETITLLAAMDVQPDSTRRALINTTITDLKAAGVWDESDLLYVMAAHDAQAGRLNWKSPGNNTLSLNNAPTFTTDEGYTGNGSNAWLGSGINASALTLYLQEDAFHTTWTRTIGSANNFEYVFNCGTNAAHNPHDGFNRVLMSINGNGIAAGGSQGAGLHSISRTGGSWFYYKNGVAAGNAVAGSNAPQASPVEWLRSENGNTGNTGGQVSFGAIGGALDATQTGDLYTAINTYLTAVGAV